MGNKIIRTICLFRKEIKGDEEERLTQISNLLTNNGYGIQTKRICSPKRFGEIDSNNKELLLSVGTVGFKEACESLSDFYTSRDNFNIELSKVDLSLDHTKVLFDIIKNSPSMTFNFAYVFNNVSSSPFMPAANYDKDGFSIGLQSTDLSEGKDSLEDWLNENKKVWLELNSLLENEPGFLGIDSSVAPLFKGKSSLVNFVNRIDQKGFVHSVTTDIYTQITKFIKENNPNPVGLCGLMLPCLEDFELAMEYEKGNFSIERNIYLSLHSGLGIDTYPIGVDEDPGRVLEILKLIQALSNKYNKPLSARFVSDGKTRIGEKTNFQNQYLYDVVIRKL